MFDFNPIDATAGFPVLPKVDGGYRVELGEAKSFHRKGKEDPNNPGTTKDDNYGIMYVSKVIHPPEHAGKKRVVNCYMHTQDSRNYSKQYQMAALGFDTKKEGDEDRFNEVAKTLDWKANPDDGSCGDGWRKMSKNVIVEDLFIKLDKENNPQQQCSSIKPLVAAP